MGRGLPGEPARIKGPIKGSYGESGKVVGGGPISARRYELRTGLTLAVCPSSQARLELVAARGERRRRQRIKTPCRLKGHEIPISPVVGSRCRTARSAACNRRRILRPS